MGYRIVYGKEPAVVRPGTGRLRLMTAVFLLLFVLAVRCCYPHGTQLLRQVLEPKGETISAFSEMVSKIQAGERTSEAVTAFCRELVADGLPQ